MASQKGLNKTLNLLGDAPKNMVKDIERLATKLAEQTSTKAKDDVAVVFGNLQSSIHVQSKRSTNAFTVTIGTNVEYALFVHENINTSGEYKYLERAFTKYFGNIEEDINKLR